MTLILVTGLPGTGKSVLAKGIVRFLPSKPIYLSTDSIRRDLFNFSDHKYVEFGKDYYSHQNRQLVYNALNMIVDILISQNIPVVVDGTFYSQETRKPLLEISKKYNCKLIVIKTICSEEVVKQRIKDRKSEEKDISDARFNIYLEIKKRFEPIIVQHLIVNTEKDMLNNLQEVGNYVEKF
jgi:predicted kinase